MRILLIDDEEELVSTMAERLSYRGIQADWAISGEDALKRVEKVTYDLAVIDVKMPGINGFELKKRLKKQFSAMKFIFLTGHGSEEDFRTGTAEAGPANYMVKPVNIDMLVEKIHEAIAGEV